MIEVKFINEKDSYFIVIGELQTSVNEIELRELNNQIDRVWFEKDVRNEIENRGLIFHEDTIQEIVDAYCYLRRKNDGDSCGMTWDECLDEAFEGYEYGDVLTDTMWQKLKEKLLSDIELASDFLGKETQKMSKESLIKKIEEKKQEYDDNELIEWYSEMFY